MKRWAYAAVWGLLLLGANASAAEMPSDAAAGVYYVRYPQALFAFRVDPWSHDVHRIQGIGRSTLGNGDAALDLYFEIRGLYRTGAAHTAQGLFLFHRGDVTQQIPWKGMYDRERKAFTWAAVVAGELKPLQPAVAPDEELRAAIEAHREKQQPAAPADGAEPAPPESNCAEPETSSPPLKVPPGGEFVGPPPPRAAFPPEVLDEKGEFDFGRAVLRTIDVRNAADQRKEAEQKAVDQREKAKQNAVDPREQSRRDALLAFYASRRGLPARSDEEIDMSIITTLISLAGVDKKEYGKAMNNVLDEYISTAPEKNVRQRAYYPRLGAPRELERLRKPGTSVSDPAAEPQSRAVPPPLYAPRSEPIKAEEKLVPSVVGLSLEGAVTALWGAGLNIGGVECLGESTDPAQADRVTKQIPAAGSIYPPGGNITLQWYSKPTDPSVPSPSQAVETKPSEPATTTPPPTATAGGFQAGDGAKVEGRFGGAQVYADGKGIAFASGGAGGGLNWMIGKLDEPMFQVGINAAKESAQRISESKSTGDTTVTFAQKQLGGGEGVVDMSLQYTGGGTTYCYQYLEYRGFFINYAESVNTPSAALGAKAVAAIEKSKQLIDLRFPK